MSAIVLNSKQNILKDSMNKIGIRFPQPYTSSEDDEISLVSLSMYDSWNNVSSQFNNVSCSYVWTNGITYPVVFPEGKYTVNDLSGYLQFVMFNNGHYLLDGNGKPVYYLSFVVNPIYYTVTLTCSLVPAVLPSGYTNPNAVTLNKVPQLVTGTNNWAKLIGFANSTSFPATLSNVPAQFNSSLIPEISPVTEVNVLCNWVSDSRFSQYPSVIDSFVSDVGSGQLINYKPPVVMSYPVNSSTYTGIVIEFVDQEYRPLQIKDRNQMQVRLKLTKKAKV